MRAILMVLVNCVEIEVVDVFMLSLTIYCSVQRRCTSARKNKIIASRASPRAQRGVA